MAQGLLIALEGIDGAGTTSQIKPLVDYLASRGHTAHAAHQPSQGGIGQLIRGALKNEIHINEASLALLFAADRLAHCHDVIVPLVKKGHIVICDRYVLSSIAYQSSRLAPAWRFEEDGTKDKATQSTLGRTWIETLNRFSWPADLSLVFDVSVDVAKERRRARGGRHEHFDDDATQTQVAQAYRALCQEAHAALGPLSNKIAQIDANQDKAQVFAACCAVVDRALGLG